MSFLFSVARAILYFLQELIDKKKAFFLSSELDSCFCLLRGVWESASKPAPTGLSLYEGSMQAFPDTQLVPPWDLGVVLKGLEGPHFNHWMVWT